MHQSIATIDSPEFINLQPLDINPLMSKCEIKVLYIGENRNHSYISKDVAEDMAKTLRGAPIVGYYKEEKEDFADHGERVILDDEGIKFECLTKPYGFVAPDARVWFQKFEDTDDFGNQIVREYLMTEGYLWTKQYEECQVALDEGRPQSMELDEESLDGHWSTNNKTGMDFFIINDAIFSKLCILGDDVEPCFEGASVTAPEVSTSFSKVDDTFKKTLYTMMQELKYALEGGQDMDTENNNVNPEIAEDIVTPVDVNGEGTDFAKDDDKTKCAKDEDKTKCVKEEEEENANSDEEQDSQDNSDDSNDNKEEEDKDKKYSLLEENYNDLQQKYSLLEEEYNKLVQFKDEIENKQKDELIKSFYMLSDEDKADVIANKAKYSLDEIEAKLSVICVRKKVNFDLDNTDKNDDNVENDKVTTYTLENTESSVPAWIAALKNTQKSKEI